MPRMPACEASSVDAGDSRKKGFMVPQLVLRSCQEGKLREEIRIDQLSLP